LSGKTDFALSVKNSGYAMHAEWGANAAQLDGEPCGVSASGAEAGAFPSGMVVCALFIERPSVVKSPGKSAQTGSHWLKKCPAESRVLAESVRHVNICVE